MKLLSILAVIHYVSAAVLGIDFGAEFTKSSLVAPNIPFEIILTPESKRKDASGLVIRAKGTDIERYYGSAGTQYTSRFPQSSLYYLKSLVGVPFDSPAVEEYLQVHPGLELVENKRNGVSVRISGKDYPVEQLVAMNFKEIKGRAQQELKQKFGSGYVSSAAISVPGYFDMTQRRAISDAAALADLQLISLVNDGVAVAINYASTRQFPKKQYIVVYDMGSESTSSTLFSIEDLNSTTITVEGYAAIPVGGKTLTTKVRDILIKEFQQKTGIKDNLEPRVLNRLWKEAERAKAVLSANTDVSVFIESLYKDLDLSTKISRDQLEEAAQEVKDEVVTPLTDSLTTFEGESISPKKLDSIILAGGGTRVPFVQQQIREFAGSILSKNVNADEAAVLGTTLRGVGISGIFRSKPIVINDKSVHSFGLNDGSEVIPMFPRGTALDTTKSFKFPAKDINLTLVENEEPVSSWSFPLLNNMIKDLESGDRKCANEPEISVRFHLTNSEVVQLTEAQVRCSSIAVEGEDENEVPRTVSRSLNAKRQDYGVTPLSAADREELSYGIRQLDKQDSDRLRKQTLHNNLESLLYKIRELAPEEERAHEILEECESNDLTVVQLGERFKEAESIYSKYKPADEQELFDADLKSALEKAGITVDLKQPIQKSLGKVAIDQLKKIELEKEGELHDAFRKSLAALIKKREAEAEAQAEKESEADKEKYEL